jgi:hypothetical protein
MAYGRSRFTKCFTQSSKESVGCINNMVSTPVCPLHIPFPVPPSALRTKICALRTKIPVLHHLLSDGFPSFRPSGEPRRSLL